MLQLGNGGPSGSIVGNVVDNSTFAINRSNAFALGGVISGSGAFRQDGSGVTTLTGANTYTGTTTVAAGTLDVEGSIANSSLTSVNSGASLIGAGTIGSAQVNSGGTFAPGAPGVASTSMTIAGSLVFQSGALYVVQVDPNNATFANVTGKANVAGTASLAGNVLAAFAPGSYLSKQYTVLHSSGLNGTTFAALGTANLPAGFVANLGYTNTDVLLNLTATLGEPDSGNSGGDHNVSSTNLTTNERNVATGLNNFFNGGGTLTPSFATIFGLTGGNLTRALDQLSGEATADGQKAAFQSMNEFLGVMLDPFVNGRSGTAGGANSFVAEQRGSLPPDMALAYASGLKVSPPPAGSLFDRRWAAWGTAYGGSGQTTGDAAAGSHDVTARTFGFAGGMDYRFTADTVAGFAVAGGGTNWGLSQELGGGRSDAFQAGAYAKTNWGPAYIGGALAFANHWMSTDRVVGAGDHLTAIFNAQSFGGRIETGYRYQVLVVGVSPYAALQAQSFYTPSYAEAQSTVGGFGLSYASRGAADTRSELGARFDDLTMINAMPLLLYGRLAWAHDWVSDPSVTAVFQSLPGASFVVNGTTPAEDSALATAGAELHLTSALSVAGKFEGEFASGSQSYAGTGTARFVC